MTVPLTTSSAAIPRFLTHIRDAGVPDKVTSAYIKSVGFKSSNDHALIGVFKTLGFIDTTGTPTQTWKDYRDVNKGRAILAQTIIQAYDGLFKIYKDAYRKDDEAIANWIRSNTTLGGVTIDRAVRTFKALCKEADFEAKTVLASSVANAAPAVATPEVTPATPLTVAPAIQITPGVSINIELHVPATNDPKIYESFFAAMKKNLFDETKQS